eukprot:COSAG04_NODE_3914_length_2425_cov_5.343508_1_plen_443_part_10
MPYHMPFRSGTSPLAWEPDAEREAERRAEIEQLLRMQQKVQLRLNPDAPLKQPAPLLVSVRPAERLAPAAKAAPTLEQGPDGTARLQYEGAGEATLPASAFQGHTMAVLVDHQHGLGPVCAAALTAGAGSVLVYRDGAAIVDLQSSPQPALMGPKLWGASKTDSALLAESGVVGGEMFETEAQREVRGLEEAQVEAEAELEKAKVALDYDRAMKISNDIGERGSSGGGVARAERRLAAVADQLRTARTRAAGGGTARELADTGDLAGMIELGAQRGDLIRRRALEASMGADWRGHSVLEYEDEGSLDGEPPRYRWHLGCILLKMPAISLLTGGHLFFSAGGPTWETVAALAVAGEDPAAPHEHGPVRVALGGASNLSALREEIVSWYTGAVKRGQQQVQLVLCVHTAGSTGAGRSGGRAGRRSRRGTGSCPRGASASARARDG